MRLTPVIKPLGHHSHVLPILHGESKFMEINAIAEPLDIREQPMEENRIGHRKNEQHLQRRKTHLTPAADIVADEVAGAQQQLPHAVHNRTRAQAPYLHHALAHAMPPDAPHAGPLGAGRAIVAREGEPAVAAAVLLLTLDVTLRLALLTLETLISLFNRLPIHPYLITD